MKRITLFLAGLISILSHAQEIAYKSIPTIIDSEAIGTGVAPTQLTSDNDFIIELTNLVVGDSYLLFNQLRNSSNNQFAGFARNPFTATSETMEFNISELGWLFFGNGILVDGETATIASQLNTDTTPTTSLSQIQAEFLVDDPDTDENTTADFGLLNAPQEILIGDTFSLDYTAAGNLLKKITLSVDADGSYANIGMSVGDAILIDNVDVPSGIPQTLNFIVSLPASGDLTLDFFVRSNPVTLNSLVIEDAVATVIPEFVNVSETIGLNEPQSIKYGGPSIADIDNDNDYDFVLNNHNAHEFAPNVVYTNNGDGNVTRGQQLSQFRLHDLHGSAAGDYDNDGDLDIAISNGGGNGTNPTPPIIYTNEGGTLIQSSPDATGVTLAGRGRSPRWVDFDLDGDLDLAFFNATPSNPDVTRHVFYANNGDKENPKFIPIAVPGLEDATAERVLITDLNNDHIDDVLMIGPLTVWKGNGDFSFTDMSTEWLPASSPLVGQIRNRFNNLAATHLDIDNDGDLDLYIAGGLGVFAISDRNSIDFEPTTTILDAKTSGSAGTFSIDFQAEADLKFYDLDLLGRNGFKDPYPIFLGSAKTENIVASIENDLEGASKADRQLIITQDNASGFPEASERTENGIYIGYVGGNSWRFETVRNGNIFFNIAFSLEGVSEIINTSPAVANRNTQDILLRNDIATGNGFVDVSDSWNIPKGGSHTGAITADFNNDGLQDILVHRYAYLKSRRSDYLLLNTGNGFEITTHHNANVRGVISHGDMGQAFDYDNDGDVDILNGDDEFGSWYLYRNEKNDNGNFATVKVGYSPVSNIDPISAEVTVTTASGEQHKRVASGGAVFSQSLLNIVHFGLGNDTVIEKIMVRWRNGEVAEFNDKAVNQFFDTDDVAPTTITISPAMAEVREGRTTQLNLDVIPTFASREVTWSSADETIATVDENGIVSGIVEGQSTTITATSKIDNSVFGSTTVSVVPFFPIAATSITLDVETVTIVEGNTRTLVATVEPADADDKDILWTSSDEAVVTVNANGIITAVADGTAVVTAALMSDPSIKDEVTINVSRFFAISLMFDDRRIYENTAYSADGNVDVSVDYHAGTGNTIASSPDQGIRFLFRHLDKDFNVISDIVVTDETAIGTESGTATVSIPLNGITPSADLTDGEFYFIFVRFTNSKGDVKNISVSRIEVVEGDTLSVEEFENEKNAITMFPNPAASSISFSGITNSDYTVSINDLSGKKLFTKEIKGTELISLETISSGFYIVTLKNETTEQVFSLIKE
ncbi:Ig-like domain-containing protein [Aquimarina agarivorans]|uniref:Ig-like domain-containing protein n=1 Tax=Aquimarina agarivorans TaxID=980584 RepID=UPI000248E883|nr:Ig-like domain-containing protein [Aquimarina agarivorans]